MTSGSKKKFLDPDTLTEAVAQIKALADSRNIRIALIGGFALQFYGSDRLTGDIDLIADEAIFELKALEPLSFGGIKTLAPNGTPTDLVLRNDDYKPLYDEALLHAQLVEGSPIPLVKPEYLAAMKMVAGRGKDSADLEYLIESRTIDHRLTRDIIKRHLGIYAAKEFDALLEEIEWKSTKKKR
jgi:hypothetical protein